MFTKVLVANRGEVAVRCLRACRELGIRTAAIYSEADKNAIFVHYADEAHLVGPPLPQESYLHGERILALARRCGADAIHPGYGFLSEHAGFARLCERDGIVFIGPPSAAIAAMGSKVEARRIAERAGVPVVPGSGALTDLDAAQREARRIGLPLLVKVANGGGGIGMRRVDREEDLEGALEAARQIGHSSFADETLYLERYLPAPRHIEIQIMADKHGHAVHLCERECSIQRRHQKLIEESPSPALQPALRARMGEAALRIVRAVGYENAGTVEFLLSDGEFYFLEMNTRLQVEHAITEIVTGIDIVKEQIAIAAGEPLSFAQEDIIQRGWAIECRINAEDPLHNFHPTPSPIKAYRSPGGIGVRVDSGVHMGYTVPPYYDSMISKLCVYGRTRGEAIARLDRALFEYVIGGVVTNIPFHKAVIRHPDFLAGETTTHFIEDHPELFATIEAISTREPTLERIFIHRKRMVAAIAAAVNKFSAEVEEQHYS